MANTKANASTRKKAPQRSQAQLQRLTAEAFGMVNLPEEEVEVPELGGTVLIRGFTGERAKLARDYAMNGGDTLDNDRHELACVFYGVIEPDLSCGDPLQRNHTHTEECFDKVKRIFNEQFVSVGRRISLAVFTLNMVGRATDISKGSG